MVQNHAEFPNPDTTKAPGTHDDIGIFSFDKLRGKIVLREFNSEGFVNQFILDSISPDKKILVFVTESLENIPPGWTGRVTLTILDDNTFDDLFELSSPGKPFKTYVKSRWRRESP